MTRHLARTLLILTAVAVFTSACAPGANVEAQAPAAAPAAKPNPLPGVTKSLDELRAEMFHVGAGKRLKPAEWPGGNRVAVALSFDVDNATMALSQGNLDYEVLSRGEYGAVDGLPRILRLLDKQKVPASFFIPASSLRTADDPRHPSRSMHEIGIHGWIHERLPVLNDEEREQRLLDQSIETLTKAMGKRPVGYRAPSWKFSKHTLAQVKAAGFLYDSSLMASDDAYEINLDGTPTGLVELPIERIVDDAPYFGAADGSMPRRTRARGLPLGVRRGVGRTRPLRAHDAPALHGPPLARGHPRPPHHAHEEQGRRVVRHPRGHREAPEGDARRRHQLNVSEDSHDPTRRAEARRGCHARHDRHRRGAAGVATVRGRHGHRGRAVSRQPHARAAVEGRLRVRRDDACAGISSPTRRLGAA
jgi:peptidoglycan/xylan/chitin deacetylase (PgdA/CDA1 family)